MVHRKTPLLPSPRGGGERVAVRRGEGRPLQQQRAAFREPRARPHLREEPAQAVVREELHDIARSEELVEHGQLERVPRCRGGVAQELPLLAGRGVLKNPPERLVFFPDFRKFRRVEFRQNSLQAGLGGEHDGLGTVWGEEQAEILREFPRLRRCLLQPHVPLNLAEKDLVQGPNAESLRSRTASPLAN